MSPADIQGNRYVENTATKLTEAGFRLGRQVKAGSSLFVCIGSTIGKVSQSKSAVTTNQQINSIVPIEDFDGNFVFSLLERRSSSIRILAATQAVPIISKGSFSEIGVCVASKPEQSSIGEFFRVLDDLIAANQRKVEQLQRLKQAYLQKLFPAPGQTVPRLRFSGFKGEWVPSQLGTVVDINPRAELPTSFEYVDLEAVVGTTLVSHRTETRSSAPSRAQRLAKRGDVFFQTVRPYQQNNYLFDLPRNDFVFSTGYAQLRSKMDCHFLMARLQEARFVGEVLDCCTGTGYPTISVADLASIVISVPSSSEQQAIGCFFQSLNDLILAQSMKIGYLKTVKQAYLQRMFV